MIDAKKTTRGFIIKVLSYGIYQDTKNYKDDSKTTARRQQDDTITKEGKEYKNNIYSHQSYLKSIPLSEQEDISKEFGIAKENIILKGKQLFDYCDAKGKVYKNYRAFLKNCLRSDIEKDKSINNSFGGKSYADIKNNQ